MVMKMNYSKTEEHDRKSKKNKYISTTMPFFEEDITFKEL